MQANEFVRRQFLPTLQPLMPISLPASFRSAAGATYAAATRVAITRTLETLNTEFASLCELAGCTLTVCLITGGLITVANIGDSDAVLDAFSQTLPMSVPHRVNDNEAERKRIADMGTLRCVSFSPCLVSVHTGMVLLGLKVRAWPGRLR
jgi:hypothetical protein